MTKIDLSVIIPSIRVQNLPLIHFMLEKAIEPFSFEVIVVGPTIPPQELLDKNNIKFLRDFGSPSRCVQMASSIAEGEYMCWLSDDCTFITQNSLAKCIRALQSCSEKDGIVLRYFEGDGGNNEFPLEYWNSNHHGDMKALSGVNPTYKIAPLGMYNTKYFKDIGGLDCKFEHINMCTHDLAFRVQNSGGTIFLSPDTVARFYWSWHSPDAKPIQQAYFENDKDYFQTMYSQDQSKKIVIEFDNWMEAEARWSRRFK